VTGVLRLPAYRRLLVAYTLNDLCWSIGSLALAVLVYRSTGSATGATAYFLCGQFVPALIAPALVARLDQLAVRIVLPALYGFEAVVFLVLAWVASHFSLTAVLALTVADGVAALTARPLARAATVAVTAPAGLLREGNALTNTAFSICFMAGPALGGLVVVTGGTAAALLVNSGLFVAGALTLLSAHGLPAPAPYRTSAKGRLRAAVAQARNHPPVRVLLGLQVTAVLIFTIVVPVAVVFAEHSLRAGAGGYAALLSAWGAGAVVGSAVYARWRRLPSGTLISIGATALGLGMVSLAAAPTLAVAIAGAVVSGVGNGIEAVAARTALQEQVEQRWMALMMSLNESILDVAPGAGIALGGAITALSGPRVALAVAGGGALVVAAGAPAVLRRARVSGRPPPAVAGDDGERAFPEPAGRR
jgi:predicted MFS family arabinose efflux permease